jgi:hypothetical protein
MDLLLERHQEWLNNTSHGSRLELIDEVIEDLVFDGKDLSCSELIQCEFNKCSFRGTKFNYANLDGCTFYDCTFTDASFVEAQLHRTEGLEYSCLSMQGFDMVTCVVIDGSPRYFTISFNGTTQDEWLKHFGINSTEAMVIQTLNALLGIG